MNPDEQTVLMIKGLVSELSPTHQAMFRLAYADIKAVEAKYGKEVARVVIALRGAELSAEEQ